MRGFAAIGLDRPKNGLNVGQVLRAAGVFEASLVVASGRRFDPACTDTMSAYRHLPFIQVEDILAATPRGAMPVVIERHAKARPLESFCHPEGAYYIFGPEDGSVLASIVERCPLVVSVSAGCLNLAATVNIVLYDRALKASWRAAGQWPMRRVA